MKSPPLSSSTHRRPTATSVLSLSLALGVLVAGCAKSTSSAGNPAPKSSNAPSTGPSAGTLMSANAKMTKPSPDPRVGLKAGAGETAADAIWNMKHISHRPTPLGGFEKTDNTDLAFTGTTVLQGNYNGLIAWDVSNPSAPVLKIANSCPSSQDDISVVGNLAFLSAESGANRLDCGAAAGRGTVNAPDVATIKGVRVFDISDITKPKYIANIQTCRGSHTHTLIEDPNDKANVYLYISGTGALRPEIPGCSNNDAKDPNSANFAIEVIKVPLAHPEQATRVTNAHIFEDVATGALNGIQRVASHGAAPNPNAAAAPADPKVAALAKSMKDASDKAMAKVALNAKSSSADTARFNKTADSLTAAGLPAPARVGLAAAPGGRGGRGGAPGLSQCHDITVYQAAGYAGGACAGMGLLLNTKDPGHPVRLDAVGDSNFSYWHSATFSNDGSKVLFSDEWGGGSAAYCRATDPMQWGGDAIFQIVNGKMVFKSYFKMPAAQTAQENCVAHNGSLIPIPGRDIMVQAFYQGGLTIFEWTDPTHPVELAYYDRGPNDATRLVAGGFWSVYWYNGLIYGSEITRGLDIFELTPSAAISQNEIDAAKTVHWDHLNVQGQPKIVWPASFPKAKAFVDQLERNGSISAGKVSEARSGIAGAEKLSGAARKDALSKLATAVKGFGSKDQQKAQMLVDALNELANM